MQNPINVMLMAHRRRELFVLPILGANRRTASDNISVMVARLSDAVQKLFGSGGTTKPKPAASTAADAIIAIARQSQPDKPLLRGLTVAFSSLFKCEWVLANMAESFPRIFKSQ